MANSLYFTRVRAGAVLRLGAIPDRRRQVGTVTLSAAEVYRP